MTFSSPPFKHLASFVFALGTIAWSPTVRANGRFPAASQIVVAKNDPTFVMTRTTFGFLVSRDRAANWDWICEGAFGGNGAQDPPLGLLDDGRVIAGLFEGLSFSSDRGCDWKIIDGALAARVMTDVVVRSEALNSALALSTVFVGQTDAGASTFTTQIFSTIDNGVTWTAFGTSLVADAVVYTIEVAPTDPHRVYVSGVRGSGMTSTAVLFVSNDDGATWIERSIPIEPDAERAPYIAAVDPANADRIYVRTDSDVGSRLLVSDDAGRTYTMAFKGVGKMLGFALSPDGTKIFLGGPDDGLWLAQKKDLTFSKRSDIHVLCLATGGTTVFACSDPNTGFVVGTSEDDGMTFVPKVRLDQLRGPLQCAANSSAAMCVSLWPTLRDALASDAGANTTDQPDAAVAPSPSVEASGGCAVTTREGETSLAILFGVIGAAAWRRKRFRRGAVRG